MKRVIKITPWVLLALPVVTFAEFTNTQRLVTGFGDLIANLIIVVAGIALLVFFWGLARFIMKSGDEKAHEEGRRIMIWGLVALFVMVSVWGLIRFIRGEIFPNTDFDTPQGLPQIQEGGGFNPGGGGGLDRGAQI